MTYESSAESMNNTEKHGRLKEVNGVENAGKRQSCELKITRCGAPVSKIAFRMRV